jgi:hypothetical protein
MMASVSVPGVVDVDCDVCHRPGWQLLADDDGGVRLHGTRLPEDDPARWSPELVGERATWRPKSQPRSFRDERNRRFIVPADSAGGWDRMKLVCLGRARGGHGRVERVVTPRGLLLAYQQATQAGRPRISMRDIPSGRLVTL